MAELLDVVSQTGWISKLLQINFAVPIYEKRTRKALQEELELLVPH